MPAVVVWTSQFARLARAVLRAQALPEAVGIEIAGNPEFVDAATLAALAAEVAEAVAERLGPPVRSALPAMSAAAAPETGPVSGSA